MVGSKATGGGDLTVNNKVFFWNGQKWEVADPNLASMGGVDHNNIAFHFAKQLQVDTGDNVRIVLDAVGSRAISEWVDSGTTSTRYASAMSELTCSSVTTVDYVLWNQGESDDARSNADYATDFNTLMSQLRAESTISATAPMIVGELREGGEDAQNVVFDDLATYITDQYVYTATCKELADVGDNIHYTGASIVTIGKERYHAALL